MHSSLHSVELDVARGGGRGESGAYTEREQADWRSAAGSVGDADAGKQAGGEREKVPPERLSPVLDAERGDACVGLRRSVCVGVGSSRRAAPVSARLLA